jgi:hypothetical protein
MLHELRIYHPMPGRLDDLVERIGAVMPPFFERHGFAPRLGQWTSIAGSSAPVFAWLLRWPSLEARMAAFAALGADGEWNALRLRTNGPGEMVRRYDLRLLSPSRAGVSVGAGRGGPACGLYEVRTLPVAVGRARAVEDALVAVELPALIATGTTVAGVFDNIFGGATPGVTLLLGWPDFEHRRQALAAYECRPEVVQARRSERQRWAGEHLLGEAGSLLLEPTRYGAADLQIQTPSRNNP